MTTMSKLLSRKTWKTYRFDQMAFEVKDRIDNPRASAIGRYVGLEHLDSGSLKIWRWGSTQDVEKTKLLFRSGDIIFGRRNAYLRRVAVADFDGLCSAHAMVLRAYSEVALPSFLPFFMQTDTFWAAALRNSAGSLSPTINWSNIANETFALPPLDEQRRIAEAGEATGKLGQLHRQLGMKAAELLQATIDEITERHVDSMETIGNLVDRGVIADPQDGNHGEKHPASSDYVAEGIPFLMAADIRDGCVDLKRCKFIPRALAESLRIGFAREGDVLLTHKATLGETAILKGLTTDFVMLTPQVTYYRVLNERELLPTYLYYAFKASGFRRQLISHGRQSTRAYIGITKQRRLTVPVPPLAIQKQVFERCHRIEAARNGANQLEASANSITRMLLEKALEQNES